MQTLLLNSAKHSSCSAMTTTSSRPLAIHMPYQGGRAHAQDLLRKLLVTSKQQYVNPLDVVGIYAGLGEKLNAFQWLNRGYEERAPMVWLGDPTFDVLRSDPRFQDLVRKIGL